MPAAPLPCLVCGVVPEPAFPDGGVLGDEIPVQPYEATVFISYGQYGSTVWDTMSGDQMLEINICDSCLTRAARHQHRVVLIERQQPELKYSCKEWNPDGSSE